MERERRRREVNTTTSGSFTGRIKVGAGTRGREGEELRHARKEKGRREAKYIVIFCSARITIRAK